MRRFSSATRSVTRALTSIGSGYRWLGGELRERAHPALEGLDFGDDNLRRLFDEGAIARRLPGKQLLDGQPDRRQ